jgi:hypothetical protein
VDGPVGEQGGRRQVAEPDLGAAADRPAQRLPLRGERRERPERGGGRVVRGVREQRDRRHQIVAAREADQRVRLRRALDEHRGRRQRVQRGGDGAGRAGAVVPHPQDP